MATKKDRWRLTDRQWAQIEPLLPRPKASPKGGRPFADHRAVFEGILWILRTGGTTVIPCGNAWHAGASK